MIKFNYEFEHADKTKEYLNMDLGPGVVYIEDVLEHFKEFLIKCGYAESCVEKIDFTQDNQLLSRTIQYIYNQLKLLKLKDCPEEEFKNIPYELIEFLEDLGIVDDKK